MMAYAGERFYRDLCMLVEERDRAVSALEHLPADTIDLSQQSAALHTVRVILVYRTDSDLSTTVIP